MGRQSGQGEGYTQLDCVLEGNKGARAYLDWRKRETRVRWHLQNSRAQLEGTSSLCRSSRVRLEHRQCRRGRLVRLACPQFGKLSSRYSKGPRTFLLHFRMLYDVRLRRVARVRDHQTEGWENRCLVVRLGRREERGVGCGILRRGCEGLLGWGG